MEFLRSVVFEEAENSTAIEKLQLEHKNRQKHIRVLEERLEEVQGNIKTKLKALDAIEEKNASLQQDIASLKGTLGYIKGTGAMRWPLFPALLQLQQNAIFKPAIPSKPSERLLRSQLMGSLSAVGLSPRELSSRAILCPEKSLTTLDLILAPSCSCLLQKQPVTPPSSSSLETNILGQGQDYITCLFEKCKEIPSLWDLLGKAEGNPTPAEYLNSSACSAIGNLKIVELHPSGHFLKIINSSPDTEEDIGDYTLQQNLNGHPIATYKFSPRIRMKVNSEIKVWTASSKMTHKPPVHFLWKKLEKFILGPQCTTILCDPSGQAVAWYTPINRNQNQLVEGEDDAGLLNNFMQRSVQFHKPRDRWEQKAQDTMQTMPPQSLLGKKKEPEFILREKRTPPLLYPVKSSWCQSPNSPTHPHYSEGHLVKGNDRNILSRQTRSQSAQHDPDSDVPCTGHGNHLQSVTGSCNEKRRRRSTRSAGVSREEGQHHSVVQNHVTYKCCQKKQGGCK